MNGDYENQEQEERDFRPSSAAEVDAEDARDRGSRRPDCQWVLSDRDVWHRNPYYTGPDQPHPEHDDPGDVPPADPLAAEDAREAAELDEAVRKARASATDRGPHCAECDGDGVGIGGTVPCDACGRDLREILRDLADRQDDIVASGGRYWQHDPVLAAEHSALGEEWSRLNKRLDALEAGWAADAEYNDGDCDGEAERGRERLLDDAFHRDHPDEADGWAGIDLDAEMPEATDPGFRIQTREPGTGAPVAIDPLTGLPVDPAPRRERRERDGDVPF